MSAHACPSCGAELPSAFPGASIACVCGHRVEIQRTSHAPRSPGAQRVPDAGHTSPPSAHGAGPYRSAAGSNAPEPSAMCPFCGNECPAMVRICPHCDVRLENVRCQRCFSLQAPGTFACMRCGHALELEPLLDASDAPCPRCNHPLEAAPGEDTRVHECPRCGGMFVPREAFAKILCSAEIGGALREGPPRLSRDHGPGLAWSVDTPLPALDVVRYVPCPLCHTSMNRVNFGKVSGVIVDVCKKHGTWFDAGELTRVVAFAASGGLERTRAREKDDQRDAKARATEVHVQLAAMEAQQDMKSRLDVWQEFLRAVLYW